MNDKVLSISDVIEKNLKTGRGYDAERRPRPLTSQEFFEISAEIGANQNTPRYVRMFNRLVDWIHQELPAKTAVEIGSGPGYLLHRLNQKGIRTVGSDGNEFSMAFFQKNHPEHADCYRLDPYFELEYPQVDMVISIEVFEHIPDAGLATLLPKIKNQLQPKFIVFSSTPHADPNPGWDFQWGHINLKQPDEWDKLFASYGYIRTKLKPSVTQWACVYVDEKHVNLLSLPARLTQKIKAFFTK